MMEVMKMEMMYWLWSAAQNQLRTARRASASSQSNVSEADESTQDSLVGNIDVSVSDTLTVVLLVVQCNPSEDHPQSIEVRGLWG